MVDGAELLAQLPRALAGGIAQGLGGGLIERVVHRVRAMDATDGGACGFAYGERFALPHSVGLTDPVGHFLGLDAPPAPPLVR